MTRVKDGKTLAIDANGMEDTEPVRYPDNYKWPEMRGKCRDPWLRSLEARDKLLESCGLERARLPWKFKGRRVKGQKQELVMVKDGRTVGTGVHGGYCFALAAAQEEAARKKAKEAREKEAAILKAKAIEDGAFADTKRRKVPVGWKVYTVSANRHFAVSGDTISRFMRSPDFVLDWIRRQK